MTGAQGPMGETGPSGLQGAQGVEGATGSTGATGPQGQQGPAGAAGVQGTQGPTGAQGNQGVQGAAGVTGAQGAAGAQGSQGAAGATGPQGNQGTTGSTGSQGPSGAEGPQGAQGPTGAQGNQGATGDIGYGNAQMESGCLLYAPLLQSTGVLDVSGSNLTVESSLTHGTRLDMFGRIVYNQDGAADYIAWADLAMSAGGPGTVLWRIFLDTDAVTKGSNVSLNAFLYQESAANHVVIAGTNNYFNVGSALASGAEHFCSFTFNGNCETAVLKIDGVSFSSTIVDAGIPVPVNAAVYTPGVYVENVYNSLHYLDGYVTELAVYSRVLTTSELTAKARQIYLTGPQGSMGAQGTQGPTGPTGSQGVAGAQGPQGVQGTTGTQGTQGTSGAQGVQGTQGPSGSTGPQGAQGLTGATGPQGNQGATGSTGSQGATGADGPQGTQGPEGTQGVQGPTGAQGIQGTQGPAGSTGSQGPQGLIGATGPQGQQGTTGPTGAQGPTGATGPQGAQGTTGAEGAQGSQGASGAQGSQGPTGSQGVMGDSLGVMGITRGLQITYSGSLSLTADEVILQTSSGAPKKLTSVSISGVSYTAIVDTGSLAVNWWYLYLLYNPTTEASRLLLSLSATSPTLPSGYTYYARLGLNYCHDSSHLCYARQIGNELAAYMSIYSAFYVDGSLTADAWTALPSRMIPPILGTRMKYVVGTNGNTVGMASDSDGFGGFYGRFSAASSGGLSFGIFPTNRYNWVTGEMINSTGDVYYQVSSANSSIILIGWRL